VTFYSITNLDIKMLYIVNENNDSLKWRYELFGKVQYLAERKFNKSKFFSEKDDVLQIIRLGMWRAISSYDYKREFDFFRWMHWNVANSLRDSFSKNQKNSAVKKIYKSEAVTTDSCYEDGVCTIIDVKNLSDERASGVLIRNILFGLTLAEIGKDIGVSPERVRQIKNKAIKNLKAESR
jgi:RNA polymerase sigma factor (sigma-70 family)